MIIFLYGQDTYRSQEKLKEITEHYKKIHQGGLNLRYFDEKKANFEDFKDELQQSSIFKEKKLLVLKGLFPNPNFKEKFFSQLNVFKKAKDIILIWEKEDVPALKKQVKSQEFRLLEGPKLKNWVKKEFQKYGGNPSKGAIEKLIIFVGNDTWRLSNEIKKLTAFSQDVTTKEVETLIKPEIASDIFKTIEAIASKDKKKAFYLIHKHLEKGHSPLYLLHMINFQFRNLLMVKETRKLNLHPYVIKKSSWLAARFTKTELKKIYQKLFETDFKIKTGRLDADLALDLFILEV